MVLGVNQVIHGRGELIFGHVSLRNDATIVLVERALRLPCIVVHGSTLEAQAAVVVGPAEVQTFL